MKDIWRILLRVLMRCTGVAFAQATTPTRAFEYTPPRNADGPNCPDRHYGHAYGEMHVGPDAARGLDQALDLLPAAPSS
jgi:hypothetical protein